MKFVWADIWSNRCRWHWDIDADEVEIKSGITFKTKEEARRHMEQAAKQLGLELVDITVNSEVEQ